MLNKKTHSLKVISLCLLSFAVVFILTKSLQQNPRKRVSALVSKQAPSFEVLKFSRESKTQYIHLEDFKGKPLILNFWASWCSSCYEDGLYLNFKNKQLKNNNLAILGIAVSDAFESAYSQWLKQKKSYLVGFDKSGDIALDYGVTGVPETFFIDAKGVIIYRHAGPLSDKIFNQYFKVLMDSMEEKQKNNSV